MCVAFHVLRIQGISYTFLWQAVTGVPDDLADLKEKLDALASILQENEVLTIRDRLSGLAR